jgi:predicted phage terminase large subunit-like protein
MKVKVKAPPQFAPASLKQRMILNSTSKITLAGGSAGSGKTFILLMVALRFMQDPAATGIIFRRTTKQINTPGGIWAEAVAMYKAIYGKRLRVKNRENEFIFPNNAVLKFSHFEYEHNKHDHQGGQYSFIAFDEGTHFTKGMITYLISRLRNAKVKYRPQMYISCNPDADHFLRQWVEFCLDENGIPIDKLADRERYFVVQNDECIWVDDRKELEKIYGDGEDSGIMSFKFIPAKCTDNPPLLKAQPDYISNLKALGRVEEMRLLHGSWTVRAEAAGYIKEKFFHMVEQVCPYPIKRIRAWDLAATIPSEVYRDPDYTVGILMSKDKEKMYLIEDMVRFRDRFAGVENKILQTAIKDGRETIIVIPVDAGAAGKAYALGLQQKFAEHGFTVQLDKTNSSKTVRVGPFAAMAESGWIGVVRGDWNEQYFRESEAFDGDKNSGQHDDIVDASASAFNKLKQSYSLPNFLLPDLTKKNNYDMKSI